MIFAPQYDGWLVSVSHRVIILVVSFSCFWIVSLVSLSCLNFDCDSFASLWTVKAEIEFKSPSAQNKFQDFFFIGAPSKLGYKALTIVIILMVGS